MPLLQMCYNDIENEEHFLTSEERQSLVYAILMNLRAQQGEVVGAITFLEGQAIGGEKQSCVYDVIWYVSEIWFCYLHTAM